PPSHSFYCTSDLRSIHSFPTRRSSDLIYKEGIQPADTLTWTGSGNNENFIAHNIAQTSNGPSITFAMENAVAKATDAADRKKKEDRKSTRLNSSHVKISYAVFCLKKKK